jgi:hypothetical protein
MSEQGKVGEMVRNPFKQLLTREEAMRAIYIDFEGRRDEPPVLLGSLYFEGRSVPDPHRLVFRHDIVDRLLWPLAGEVTIDGVYRYDRQAKTLPQAVHDVVRRAKHQKRPIVAWSHHEITVLEKADLSPYVRDLVRRWFRDGKATARRWRTAVHPDWSLSRDESGRADRLMHYVERIGYEVPSEYAGGEVGETIRRVRKALSSGKDWEALTPNQRERWRRMLHHNYFDCDGLRTVVQVSADELSIALS